MCVSSCKDSGGYACTLWTAAWHQSARGHVAGTPVGRRDLMQGPDAAGSKRSRERADDADGRPKPQERMGSEASTHLFVVAHTHMHASRFTPSNHACACVRTSTRDFAFVRIHATRESAAGMFAVMAGRC